MSLQGALNFISSGGNIGNKVSKVNIWGPNITNAVNMFNVNSASITDFFAYVPNATDVNGMMNSKALNVADIDCGVAPFVAGLVLGNVGANAMTMLNLVSNYGYTKGHTLGLRYAHTKLHDFTFFTNAPLAGSGVGKDNSLFTNMYWNSLRNLTVIIPNAINAYVFSSNLTTVSGSGNFISLQRINIVANSAIRINANTTYNCGASNVKNQSKIVEGYFPNIIDAPGLFAGGQKGVNNIHAYGIDYTKLQNGTSMFSGTNISGSLNNVNMQNAINASYMFSSTKITSVENVIFGEHSKSNSANLQNLFYGCSRLEIVRDSKFFGNYVKSTSTVKAAMSNMFSECNNLKTIENCMFVETNLGGSSGAPFFGSNITTLKNISLARYEESPSLSATSCNINLVNHLETIENIMVNIPGYNNKNIISSAFLAYHTKVTSPSTTVFFDVGAGAYLDTHNTPPPEWLTGSTNTSIFANCTNMPDYDLIHANWK